MKLTKIAIALVAVLAMSAVVASGASAFKYNATSSPVMLHGTQEAQHVFAVDGQKVTCNVAEFDKASQTAPANEVSGVEATYNNCTAFGFAGANVNMGNCTYTFKQPSAELESMVWTANVGLFCSGATPVTVKSSVFGSECEVTIAQSGNENLSHLTIKVLTPSLKWLINIIANAIKANKVKDNGLCPLSGTGETNTATYNGSANAEGTEGIGINIEA